LGFFRNHRGSELTLLVLVVLVLIETVLVLEGTCWDVVDLRPKYCGSSFPEKTIALNRFERFRVRVRVRVPRC
jgi:hypothetical protein